MSIPGSGRPRSLRLFAVGAAVASVLAVTANSGQARADTSSSAPPASPGAALGVSASSDGWLSYTNTMSSKLKLAGVATRTVAGHRGANGSCQVTGSNVAKPGSGTTFEEEVALNPTTCDEKIVTGTLDQAGVATLNALPTKGAVSAPTAGTASPGPARASATAAGASTPARTGSGAKAAATTFSYAYTKTAWIDPVNITITSLTPNIQYPLWGSGPWVYYWTVPYEFPYDGWSSTGVNNIFSYLYPSDTYGWQVEAVDHFTNTDFATFIYLTFGLSGWLACGAVFSVTAHFNHDVIVQGYANGNRGAGYNDSADGACANLVHHASWSGWGTGS
jgi:hypothetical protein